MCNMVLVSQSQSPLMDFILGGGGGDVNSVVKKSIHAVEWHVCGWESGPLKIVEDADLLLSLRCSVILYYVWWRMLWHVKLLPCSPWNCVHHDSRCSVEVLLTTTRLCCYDGLPYLLIISTYSPHIIHDY